MYYTPTKSHGNKDSQEYVLKCWIWVATKIGLKLLPNHSISDKSSGGTRCQTFKDSNPHPHPFTIMTIG